MPSGGPWSVKGIDPRARARAKTAARAEGMTLGEWLNRVILDDGPDNDGNPAWENHLSSYPGFSKRDDEGDALLRGMVERLTQRVETTERQSVDVLNDVDRSLSELAERVETTDTSVRQEQARTKQVAEAARKAAEALALRVKRIEDAGGSADKKTLDAFENAFGKLAARVFRNESDSQHAAEIMQSALDEFGQATEQATLSLQKRIEAIEAGQSHLGDELRQSGQRNQTAGRALTGLHDAADRLRRRVEDSERLTHDVANTFEQSVSRIDTRLRALESRPLTAGSADIDRRFNTLSDELASVVANTRSEIARELENVASESRVERLERSLKSAEQRIAAAESAHSESLSRIGVEITQLARALDDRITQSEKKAEALHMGDKAEREMERRFETLRTEQREAVERLGQSLSDRVEQSEARAANAIETATQSMSEAVGRLEEQQAVRTRESDLETRLRQSEERTARRIEDAISGISERLEEARSEAAESLTPVQRAMNALADRLEAIENRSAPAQEPTPEPAAADRRPSFTEPDFDTPLSPPPDAETPPGFDADEVDDPFIISEAPSDPGQARAEVHDEFLAEPQAEPGQRADLGMILQPMEPVDEPVPQPRQQTRTRPKTSTRNAPLGATADADFLAAARSRTKSNRTASFDPYEQETSGGSSGRTIMIAASVLGFVAIASAATMLLLDSFNREPASAAEALSADVLGNPATPSAAEATRTAVQETPPPQELVTAPEESPVETAPTDIASEQSRADPTETNAIATPADAAREIDLQADTALPTTVQDIPQTVTISTPTLQEAAAGGDPVARYLLGEERLSSGNIPAAAALIRRAAEQNVPAAQFRYARMLDRGQGMDADPATARQWYRRAAEAGHRRAMHNLASMYATGHGGEANIEEAARWFEEAALRGLTDSQFNLAILFQQGQGRPQSAGDAYAWFSIAAANGDRGAAQQAAALAPTLDEDVRNQANAIIASFQPRNFDPEINGEYERSWGQTVTLDTAMIASAQNSLNRLGYNAGPADGQWGPRTEAAVRAYQTEIGVPATGVLDAALIGRLENARAG